MNWATSNAAVVKTFLRGGPNLPSLLPGPFTGSRHRQMRGSPATKYRTVAKLVRPPARAVGRFGDDADAGAAAHKRRAGEVAD